MMDEWVNSGHGTSTETIESRGNARSVAICEVDDYLLSPKQVKGLIW